MVDMDRAWLWNPAVFFGLYDVRLVSTCLVPPFSNDFPLLLLIYSSSLSDQR
jgi:hypothetical protein